MVKFWLSSGNGRYLVNVGIRLWSFMLEKSRLHGIHKYKETSVEVQCFVCFANNHVWIMDMILLKYIC